jgi:hypothetical protein
VWATSDVLTPQVSTLRAAGARRDVVAAVNDDPATFLGAAGTTLGAFTADLSGWQRTLRELQEQRGPDAHAEKLRHDALGIARLNVENQALTARRIVAFGHFRLVRELFLRARTFMVVALATVALGIGLFVAGTVAAGRGSSDSTVANLGYPASVRLVFNDAGRKELGDRLSAACMRKPVPAYLFAGDWVVTGQGTGCRSVAFRWTSALGTIRLP